MKAAATNHCRNFPIDFIRLCSDLSTKHSNNFYSLFRYSSQLFKNKNKVFDNIHSPLFKIREQKIMIRCTVVNFCNLDQGAEVPLPFYHPENYSKSLSNESTLSIQTLARDNLFSFINIQKDFNGYVFIQESVFQSILNQSQLESKLKESGSELLIFKRRNRISDNRISLHRSCEASLLGSRVCYDKL